MRNAEKYSIYNAAWTNDTPDPDELLGVALDFSSQHAAHTFYNNPKAKELLLQQRRELDPKKRQALVTELQRIVNQDCPQIYVVHEPRIYATTPAVVGLRAELAGEVQLRGRDQEVGAARGPIEPAAIAGPARRRPARSRALTSVGTTTIG